VCSQGTGKKKVHKREISLLWTCLDYKVSIFPAGLLTYGSFSGCTFPSIRFERVSAVASYSLCPRLQRWPNVTDLHRIPFSSPGAVTPESYFMQFLLKKCISVKHKLQACLIIVDYSL